MSDLAQRVIAIITEAAGPEHPENWSQFDYRIKDEACVAAAEIERLTAEVERLKADPGLFATGDLAILKQNQKLKAEVERLHKQIELEQQYSEDLVLKGAEHEARIAALQAVVDAAKEFKEWWHEDMRGSVSYDKLCAALAALKEADDDSAADRQR